jgi:hypothetical protein
MDLCVCACIKYNYDDVCCPTRIVHTRCINKFKLKIELNDYFFLTFLNVCFATEQNFSIFFYFFDKAVHSLFEFICL